MAKALPTAGPAAFTNNLGSAQVSAADYGLLSQFGVNNTGAVAGHTNYSDLQKYLDSQTGAVDARIKQSGMLQGTASFNSAAYTQDQAIRTALNKLRVQYALANESQSLASSNPSVKAIQTLLNSTDAGTQAAIQAAGGVPDVSVLSNPAAASQWLQSVKGQIADSQAKAQTAAQNAAAAAQETQQQTADTASLQATTSQQFQQADNAYQAALSTAGSTFDKTSAAQQAGRQSDAASLARGAGIGAVSTISGAAEGLSQAQGAADRTATISDAQQTAASALATAYENALTSNISGTSLSSQQQTQVHQQAADALVAQIQQEFNSLSIEQQSQLANVQNLLSQYKNSVVSAQQKQNLLGSIIQGVLGAGGAVAGAFLGGPAGAAVGGSAGAALGGALGKAA